MLSSVTSFLTNFTNAFLRCSRELNQRNRSYRFGRRLLISENRTSSWVAPTQAAVSRWKCDRTQPNNGMQPTRNKPRAADAWALAPRIAKGGLWIPRKSRTPRQQLKRQKNAPTSRKRTFLTLLWTTPSVFLVQLWKTMRGRQPHPSKWHPH